MLSDSIACKTISGKNYLVNNTSIECYTKDYNIFSFAFIIPMLLVWVIVIPLIFLYFLNKAKYTHRSQNYSIKKINK